MEHTLDQTAITVKSQSRRLHQAIVLISGVCLAGLFYTSGTFNKSRFSPRSPSGDHAAAAGGPVFRTTATTSVTDVVTKAQAFKALLTTAQQATLQQTYTATLARKWSNLPCGATCRNGIEFGSLSATQLTAALDVIKAALGTGANNGYDEFIQNRLAEAYLHANGGGAGYDSTLRWICFLNDPATTGGWMLQFGGHHYAANISFNNGHVIGATPFFQGLEPLSFTMNGTTYAPMTDEHDSLTAMLASFTTAQLATAKLAATFSDCTMVPGESNGGTGTFPATKVGIACSTLSPAQKSLVLAAIRNYVEDMDATTAAAIMAVYTGEIDDTYIAYTGNGTSGNPGSFLGTNSNYVRIDGPTVWIELACQNGIVFPGQIHYHTVWRDHSHDYGVDLNGASIDGSGTSSVAQVSMDNHINVYPDPAGSQLTLALDVYVKDAAVLLVNTANGQATTLAAHVSGTSLSYDVSRFPSGMYILKVVEEGTVFTARFSKL